MLLCVTSMQMDLHNVNGCAGRRFLVKLMLCPQHRVQQCSFRRKHKPHLRAMRPDEAQLVQAV